MGRVLQFERRLGVAHRACVRADYVDSLLATRNTQKGWVERLRELRHRERVSVVAAESQAKGMSPHDEEVMVRLELFAGPSHELAEDYGISGAEGLAQNVRISAAKIHPQFFGVLSAQQFAQFFGILCVELTEFFGIIFL